MYRAFNESENGCVEVALSNAKGSIQVRDPSRGPFLGFASHLLCNVRRNVARAAEPRKQTLHCKHDIRRPKERYISVILLCI
jgi:hypothetical protein